MYQAGGVPSLDFFGFFVKIFCNFMFLIGLNFFLKDFSGRFGLFYDVEFFGGYDVFCHFREKKGNVLCHMTYFVTFIPILIILK